MLVKCKKILIFRFNLVFIFLNILFYIFHLIIIVYDFLKRLNSNEKIYTQTETRMVYKLLTICNNIFCLFCTISFFKLGKDLIE